MAKPCIVALCENIGTHLLPKDETRRAQWLQAIVHLKPGLSVHKYSKICSTHFKKTDFSRTALSLLQSDIIPKTLKKTAIPSVFPWNTEDKENPSTSEDKENPSTSECQEAQTSNFIPPKKTYSRIPPITFVEEQAYLNTVLSDFKEEDPLTLSTEDADPSPNETFHNAEDSIDMQMRIDVAEEIEIPSQSEFIFQEKPLGVTEYDNKSVQTQDDYVLGFSIHNYKKIYKGVHFYTGLESFDKLMLVFSTLGPNAHNLNYFYGRPPQKLDALDKFFITLIILRRHKPIEEIAMMFQVSIKQIYNIFITWIRFMSLQWKNVDIWVDRETVKAYMPLDFYDQYPATRVIIDATESPIQKPKLPLAQQVTFSSYKNRNTIKFLVGITPGGLISYISPSYGGSATDRQIIERSSRLDRFNANDEIMVDKGFNVQDIFLPYNVKVNMPSFFKKGNQIGAEALTSNRKVSSKRVHVERVIGLLKTYKILTEPMNQTEIILSSDIVFVCAMLVNFRSNIMNKR